MQSLNIFLPMLAMMLLTFIVWVYMYAKRIPFIQTLDLEPDEVTPAKLAELSPPTVSNASDNLKNLFELPVLFYALCLYLHITNQVDTVYVIAAWIFVLFRYIHSAMHCTRNIILARFGLYLISSLALWFILFRASWAALDL
jgi:hypothetical protein